MSARSAVATGVSRCTCREHSTMRRSHISATNVVSRFARSRHCSTGSSGTSNSGSSLGGGRATTMCLSPSVKPTDANPRGGSGTLESRWPTYASSGSGSSERDMRSSCPSVERMTE